ncbi:deubiquitinase MYSM1 isoform X1 [Canis lupus baileyi]|uniref:histone H2A deubiquitinase MYSM1 isoform X1 n=1 Tax=Canis lupus familiaris TaxID=9615 RepID=UPI000DC6CFB7|nr:histone H2A deubiquitinase MYSM1 isoform X1 [Canis lupus familiaris]XP_048966335.1 deubiquitinase MYSM1 isoform X1 [Canis lupus dingo]
MGLGPIMAAEEADVDIEGDVVPAAAQPGSDGNTASVLQDHYLDSSWRTENGLIPWTLDSTISEENRAVIEKMLLEEEYYLSKNSLPEKFWLDQKEDDKKYMKSLQKTAKIMAHSPTKSASYSVKWTIEEKELFEQGLAKFGRRWTKIAKLIGSRTVLQVKSYARQYFKNKVKLDGPEKETPNQKSSSDLQIKTEGEGTKAWTPSDLRGRADPNLNAIKIEQLSDDEEIDITDEADELTSQAPQKNSSNDVLLNIPSSISHESSQGEFIASYNQEDSVSKSSKEYFQNIKQGEMEALSSSGSKFWTETQNTSDKKSLELNDQKCNKMMKNSEKHDGSGIMDDARPLSSPEPCEVQKHLSDNELLFHSSYQMEDESHEEEELKPPEQEVEIDRNTIQEEEKQAIPEFFEGRHAKTPERYLKIRNYILDQWEICKPKYLNKTSVRPGLKNCGDVNCIGRIHTYLELIGAINFGCEQAVYNRPQPVDKVRVRDRKDTVEAYQLAQRLQSMRTRRRRVRDPWGNWCDAKDLEGQTFEHLSAEELARRKEEKCKPVKSSKVPRPTKRRKILADVLLIFSSFDPFQLIPCNFFSEEKQEPFQVKVASEALLIMDLHAHVSMAEVIGLLGGRYSEVDKVVEVCAAEPCNSLSTGLQCEMDPVSQTQASETLAVRGYSVIGWYHSHPAFDPNPSLRDIDTQAKYQSYFSRGGAKFIGMIVSPYNQNNPLPYSQITCLVISDEISSDGSYRLPYKFEVQQMLEEPQWGLVFEKTRWIIEKYRLSHSSVPMDKIFHRDSDLTCLQKLLECLRKTLSKVTNCFIAEEFLTQIENLFLSNYKSKQENGVAEENCAVGTKELLM